MRTKTAAEAQLESELNTAASHVIDEIEDLHRVLQERQQRIESLQEEIGRHIFAAAQWEARFDRLLRIASGEGIGVVKCE